MVAMTDWVPLFNCTRFTGKLTLEVDRFMGGRSKGGAHGSSSRMAETIDAVFQPTSLSAAVDTTDETCSFAHGRIPTIGLS